MVMDEAEFRLFARVAKRQGIALSEWVRQTLRSAQRDQSAGAADRKLAAIGAAARHRFPAPDIDEMLAEIERGYGEDA
ncbi:MAG: antitoxin [Myxococcales bacterium]|nr:antitoxin [Myxococcales bacterium]